MSVKNIVSVKKNVMVYNKRLPHILMDTDISIIVRIGIPADVYNECKRKIHEGQYIRTSTVTRVMHMEGHLMRHINASLASLNIDTEYIPGNIVGLNGGDSSVFTPELYVIPPDAILDSNKDTNTVTVNDEDLRCVRIIDYIVPINKDLTESIMGNMSHSIKFDTKF